MLEHYFGHRNVTSGHLGPFTPSETDFGPKNAQGGTGIFDTFVVKIGFRVG